MVAVLQILLGCLLSTALGKEIEVQRSKSVTLPCEIKSFSEIDLVRWKFVPRGSQSEQLLLEWSPPSPTQYKLSDDRYTFNNQTYELEIRYTNFANIGGYICETYTIDNTTETLDYKDAHDVIVNDSPSQPPGQPVITILSATEMRIDWQRSEENNSPLRGYYILIKTNQILSWDDAMSFFVAGDVNSTVKDQLWPFTEYQVKLMAENNVGKSIRSNPSEIARTMEGVPDGKPRILSVKNTTSSIYFNFSTPPTHSVHGVVQGYEVTCKEHAAENPHMEAVLSPNATEYNITGLKAYTVYVITLRIFNNAESGPETEVVVWTDEGVPSAPRITNLRNRTDTLIQLEWEKPSPANGILQGYIIYWSHGSFNYSKRLHKVHQDIMTYTLRDLKPYTDYELRVSAFTRMGEGPQSSMHPGLTDVTGPSAPDILNVTANASSMELTWSRPKRYHRLVNRYVVRLDNLYTADVVTIVVDGNGEDVQKEVVYDLDPGTPYDIIIAGQTRSLFSDHYYQGADSIPVSMRLEKLPSPPPASVAPGEGEYGDGNGMTLGIITGVICTALLLLLAGVLLVFTRRYIKSHYSYIGDPDAPPPHAAEGVMLPDAYDESCLIRDDVPVVKWKEHVCRNHADGDLLFSQEYDDINQATRTDLTVHHSTDPDNKHKNRYVNIHSYDHSRVVLKNPLNRSKGDYINANYVDGYHQPRAYIAAQGPLPGTFADYWSMVWEQNSSVIVMITNLMERGRRKCDQYWPSDGETTYGAVSVKLQNTFITAHYTVRVFSVRHAKDRTSVVKKKLSNERVVYQYHYTDWPDHGVPYFTLPVLQFVRKSVATASKEGAGPPIVHCSAGVGRTGTYIVIDSMMRQIADKGTLNVFSFLSHIRNQRNYLVQTEEQYIFLHDALLEHLEAGVTETKDTDISATIEQLLKPMNDMEGSPTHLFRQYQLVTNFWPQDYHMASAKQQVNLEKNRSQAILPVEPLRVRLPARPGIAGSDYINASFLQGYNKNLEYIVTQHPLSSTVEDFWRMVWDQNSFTIVLLSPVSTDTDEYPLFWPALKETTEYGHFKVTLTEETTSLSFMCRDFLLQSTQDDYECLVRLLSTSYWPESCEPLSSVFELIQTVKAWDQQQQEQQLEGPTIVVDKLGGCEAATFCALSTLYDQLRHEGTVDVYQVAKLYHLKRPNMLRSLESYQFLYKAIESIAADDSFPLGDKDSGISNCNSYPPPSASLVGPVAGAGGGGLPALPLTPITRSVSHTSTNGKAETTM